MSILADKRGRWLLAAAAAMFTLLAAEEIYQSDEPVTLPAVLLEVFEVALLVGSSATAALLVLQVQAQGEESRMLRQDVQVVRAESQRWREEMADHLRELGAGIRRQFEAWSLTTAEQEVGFLLLKGLSHKEIARLRNTSEATIRQQAASIYQKANLSGRAALSAFFLEDLLAPPTAKAAASNGRDFVVS